MNEQMERINRTDHLLNVFNYAFVETAPYNFFIPREDKYVAVNLPKKMYHCLDCQMTLEIHYNQSGVVYFSKERFEQQRALYEKCDLIFPSAEEIKAGKAFVYHEEGYCSACANKNLAQKEIGQSVYNQCFRLHQMDEALLEEAKLQMGNCVKDWLNGITESAQLMKYDLSTYPALKDLVCAIILDDLAKVEQCVKSYVAQTQQIISEVYAKLDAAAEKWQAYAARPVRIYESMSDELYHEYTVVFPVKETPNQIFYVYKTMEKSRVKMFLEQTRIQTTEELVAEAGFLDVWVDWFIAHVTALQK